MNLSDHVHALVARYQQALGLEQWDLRVEVRDGTPDDTTEKASCASSPEYRQAVITLHAQQLETGDDLEEIVAHELAHCLAEPLGSAALTLADAAAAGNPHVAAALREWVRIAEETVVTDVGRVVLRLVRARGTE